MQFLVCPRFHSLDGSSIDGEVQVYHLVWEMQGSLEACLLPLQRRKKSPKKEKKHTITLIKLNIFDDAKTVLGFQLF